MWYFVLQLGYDLHTLKIMTFSFNSFQLAQLAPCKLRLNLNQTASVPVLVKKPQPNKTHSFMLKYSCTTNILKALEF